MRKTFGLDSRGHIQVTEKNYNDIDGRDEQ